MNKQLFDNNPTQQYTPQPGDIIRYHSVDQSKAMPVNTDHHLFCFTHISFDENNEPVYCGRHFIGMETKKLARACEPASEEERQFWRENAHADIRSFA